MVDPAGGSFVLRYAGVTSTAVQPGAEFARVMSVIDVSTEHTIAIGQLILRLVPLAAETAFGPRPVMALVAQSTVRRSNPGVRSTRCSERGHKRALGSKSP